jgi:hypothetical protein
MLKPFVLIAVCAAVSIAPFSRAADNVFVETAALIEAAWSPSSEGLSEAQTLYDKLRQQGRASPRVTYALALVYMRNLKYDEAKRLLDQVLAAKQDELGARRAKAWVLMITRDYPAALVELENLVKQVVAIQKASPEPGNERLIEFAGRVMGFLDGPAATAVDPHVRTDYRRRLDGLLSAAQQKTFDGGYREVQRRFAELDLDRQQTKADAKADAELRRERIVESLKREQAAIDHEKDSLQSRAETAASEVKSELDRIDARLTPLTTRQARLEAQTAALVGEIASLQAEVARLLDLSDWVGDPLEALRLRAEARRLDTAWRRFDVDLRTTQGELAGVAAQRVTLVGERQAAVARQRALKGQVDRQLSDIRRSERRLTSDLDKATQPISGNTPATHSLAIRARAFTTYETFPFEEERARLLQSLSSPQP